MLVVSNTSPVSNLAVIGRLELLRAQFDQVLIPPAVVAEPEKLPGASARSAVNRAIEDAWLKLAQVENLRLAGLLSAELHRGGGRGDSSLSRSGSGPGGVG